MNLSNITYPHLIGPSNFQGLDQIGVTRIGMLAVGSSVIFVPGGLQQLQLAHQPSRPRTTDPVALGRAPQVLYGSAAAIARKLADDGAQTLFQLALVRLVRLIVITTAR